MTYNIYPVLTGKSTRSNRWLFELMIERKFEGKRKFEYFEDQVISKAETEYSASDYPIGDNGDDIKIARLESLEQTKDKNSESAESSEIAELFKHSWIKQNIENHGVVNTLKIVTKIVPNSIVRRITRSNEPYAEPIGDLSHLIANEREMSSIDEISMVEAIENSLSQQEISKLKNHFVIIEEEEIKSILSETINIYPILLELGEKVREAFPNEELIIKPTSYIDFGDTGSIIVYIKTKEKPVNAIKKLEAYDKKNELDYFVKSEGLITLSLSYNGI